MKHGILSYIPRRTGLRTLELGSSLKWIYSLIELLEYCSLISLHYLIHMIIFFIQYLPCALYIHFFFIHLNHTKIHKVNYHPCFSHKETEGHRVHTTSKIARIWTDSALSTTALSVHKTLLWPSTVWTTFKFQKCLFLPFFLYFPVSLKSTPYLENFNLSFQCLLKYGLLWFSWAWPWELLLLNAFYTSYFCHGHVHQSTC